MSSEVEGAKGFLRLHEKISVISRRALFCKKEAKLIALTRARGYFYDGSMSAAPRHTLLLTGQHAVFILEDGTRLTAELRVSARARRARLALTPEGALRLTLPPMTRAAAEEVVRNMLPWLEKAWRRHCLRRPLPVLPTQIALPLLAANFAVRHAGTLAEGRRAASLAPCGRLTGAGPLLSGDGSRRLLLLERERELLLYGGGGEDSLPAAAALLRRWGRHAADVLLPPLLRELAAALGLSVDAVRCRDQRTLWGSCRCVRPAGRQGGQPLARISLNWRAVLLPAELARHLCLHELCHIGHRGHSPAYRAALEVCSPDSGKKERALTEAWGALPWWTRHEAR